MKLAAGLLLGLAALSAHGQSIEGYWQDTERRILFAADAPPGFQYGGWMPLDQNQTYPSAKQIRKGTRGVEVIDFLYDDEEVLTVRRADEKTIEFTRASTWSRCSVLHRCDMQGANEMLCALETSCGEQVVWRGEERYARRASCERVEVRRAQGVPHRCR